MGVIDTLAAGFQTVAKRPWLILVAVVLDLFLWLGPTLSGAPAVAILQESLTTIGGSQTQSIDQPAPLGMSTPENWEVLKQRNLFGLLAWHMPPSLAQLAPLARPGLPPIGMVTIPTPERLLIAVGGLMLIGLVITSAYQGAIAQYIRFERFNGHSYFDRLGVNWLRLIGLYALILVGVLAVGLPVGLVSVLLYAFVPPLATAILLVFGAALVWVMFFLLFFAVGAIFVADLGPLEAVRSSVGLVQRNFWSALGLIMLTYLIGYGTGLMWGLFQEIPVLFAIAVAGNAFIWSGLTAATMIYYRDRTKGGQRGRLTARS